MVAKKTAVQRSASSRSTRPASAPAGGESAAKAHVGARTAARKPAKKTVTRGGAAVSGAPAGVEGEDVTTGKKAAVRKVAGGAGAAKKVASKKAAPKKVASKKAASPARDASGEGGAEGVEGGADRAAPVKKATKKATKRATKKAATKTVRGRKTVGGKKSVAVVGDGTEAVPAGGEGRKAAGGRASGGVKASGKKSAAKTTGATTVVAKKTRGTATAAKKPTPVPKARIAAAEPGELAVRPGEDPWTPEEVEEARAGLLTEAQRLRDEIASSEASIVGLMRDSGDGAGDDEADTGTKNITREHEMALAANAREMLEQSERALERLDAGTYGICENCGNPIGKARMQAFPRATLCVECKQKQERRY
ncbi:TraR/DksA family transcriptional regulator [Streptomyces sp. NPDC058001]|uniref:TraR/DksA family transcriptional regulator n=1 Tax=Streptomyces sp. NPDC058001 TaxID=3346300 RepID=UPI0036E1D689